MKVLSTAASNAEKELSSLIGYENRIYKPWHLAGHQLETVRLHTTADELKLLWNQPAYLRPGFIADEKHVEVPVFFSMLSYMDSDFVDAFSKFQTVDPSKGLLIRGLGEIYTPLKDASTKEYLKELVMPDGKIDEKAFLAWQESPIGFLRPEYQKNVLRVIETLSLTQEGVFMPWIKGEPSFVVETVLTLSQRIWNMYHQYDFQYNAPKVLVLHKAKIPMSVTEAYRLRALTLLGFDVFIVSPHGYSLIEKGFIEGTYDLFFGSLANGKKGIDPAMKEQESVEDTVKVLTGMGYATYGLFILFILLLISLLFRGASMLFGQ